jgi:hypothetical protein
MRSALINNVGHTLPLTLRMDGMDFLGEYISDCVAVTFAELFLAYKPPRFDRIAVSLNIERDCYMFMKRGASKDEQCLHGA